MKIILSLYSDIPTKITPTGSRFRLPNFYEALVKSLAKYNDVLLLVNNDLIHYQHVSNKAIDGFIAKQYGKCVEEFNPDLIIAVNNSFCSDFKYKEDCPYLILTVDSIKCLVDYPNIKCNKNTYILIPALGMVEEAKELGFDSKNIIYSLSPTGVYAEELTYIHDISFIGSVFTNGILSNISEKIHSKYKKEFDNVINSYENDRKTKFIKRISTELSQEINHIKSSDLFIKQYFDKIDMFCLNDLSQKFRKGVLLEASKFNLGLYGTPDWLEQDHDISEAYIRGFFYSTKHNQDIYNSSRINLNICHKQAIGGFPWRITDVMASNGMLLSDDSIKNTWNKMYPSIKLPFYGNKNEISKICKKYLSEDNLRKDLISQCQEEVDMNHRFENLFDIISDAMYLNLTDKNTKNITYTTNQIENFISTKDYDIEKENHFFKKISNYTTYLITNIYASFKKIFKYLFPGIFKYLKSKSYIRNAITKLEILIKFRLTFKSGKTGGIPTQLDDLYSYKFNESFISRLLKK